MRTGARCSTPAHRFIPGSGYSGRVETTPPSSARDVDRADGAAVAVSRAAADRVGLLDDALFLYVEDVDWSLRMRAAGFAVVLVPDARVRHKGSAATGGRVSTVNLYYDTRNTIVVDERHAPLPAVYAVCVASLSSRRTSRRLPTHAARIDAARAVLAGWRDARAGRLGQRSSR